MSGTGRRSPASGHAERNISSASAHFSTLIFHPTERISPWLIQEDGFLGSAGYRASPDGRAQRRLPHDRGGDARSSVCTLMYLRIAGRNHEQRSRSG
jgi:hypothetical protein